MDLISYTPTELEAQLDKVTELDTRVDLLESTDVATLNELTTLESFSFNTNFIPSFSYTRDVSSPTTDSAEQLATGTDSIKVTTSGSIVHIALGASLTEALYNLSYGVVGETLFILPVSTSTAIIVNPFNYVAWKSITSSSTINIAQGK